MKKIIAIEKPYRPTCDKVTDIGNNNIISKSKTRKKIATT